MRVGARACRVVRCEVVHDGWSFLATVEHREPVRVAGGFRLACTLDRAIDPDEAPRTFGPSLPPELASFWATYRGGTLFRDIDFGQWGLVLHAPDESRDRTMYYRGLGRHLVDSDIVFGEFLGDLDLLVIEPSGRTLIAAPLDPRHAWFSLPSLRAFLEEYVEANGAKFWEARLRRN
jgi:hypothetical protein